VWGYLTDAVSRMYVRARHYRADTARWLTVDPLWPRHLVYSYCDNSPQLQVDPLGTAGVGLVPPSVPVFVSPCWKHALLLLYAKYDNWMKAGDHYAHCMFYCVLSKSGCDVPILLSEYIEWLLNLCYRFTPPGIPYPPILPPPCKLLRDAGAPSKFFPDKGSVISLRDIANNFIGKLCGKCLLSSCEACCGDNAMKEGQIPELPLPPFLGGQL